MCTGIHLTNELTECDKNPLVCSVHAIYYKAHLLRKPNVMCNKPKRSEETNTLEGQDMNFVMWKDTPGIKYSLKSINLSGLSILNKIHILTLFS